MGEAEDRAQRIWLGGLQDEAITKARRCKELAHEIYDESIDAANYFERAASWLEEAEQEISNKSLEYAP